MTTAFRHRVRYALLSALIPLGSAVAEAPGVKISRAEQQAIVEEVHVNGSVVSLHSAALSPAVAGLVVTIKADIGDRVAKGDVLLELDAEIAAAETRSAQAQVEEARVSLADARRRLREARSIRTGVSESEIKSLETEVAVQEQRLARLTAALDSQREQLERHRIHAPFTGVINDRSADPGEWITPGTGAFELVDMDNMRLDFQVPQSYFPRISSSTAVTATLEALPERALKATVSAIAPVHDTTARTFRLRTVLADADLAITPGMAARGVLSLDTGRRSVVISRDALARHPDGRTTVWVVSDTSQDTATVNEQRVETGLNFKGNIEILSGLKPGQPVVIIGNEALRDGQTVRIVNGG